MTMSRNSRTPAEIEETLIRMRRDHHAVTAEMDEIRAQAGEHVCFLEAGGGSDDEREQHRAAIRDLQAQLEKSDAKRQSLKWELDGVAEEIQALARAP